MNKIAENKKETFDVFLAYTFGILVIAIGGLLGSLDGWKFWFPLGLLTMPWIWSLINVCKKE